jgi:argininosuccinate lyase
LDKKGENLWGGRFTGRPDPQFAEFNRSFGFDRRLLEFDIEASIAHCKGLISAGVLTKEEGEKLTAELGRIRDASREPAYIDSDKVEDVHSFIEAKLIETLGDLGKKLHTGRSRNDQVATAFRLWVRASLDKTLLLIKDVQNSLLDLADAHSKAVLPGYTHLQKAQPVLFAHWCLAYFEMFSRDRERITEARKRANVCPLGSGALAGTSYPIDREMVARSLGFEAI